MKTILITGASGNLGTATVKKFSDEGYTVVPATHTIDLTDEETAAQFVQETIKKHGSIEGALLLVGGFAMGKIEETSLADLNKMRALNFDTAFNIAKPIFKHMMERKYGRIVFVGARPALKPEQGKNMIAYALSKSLLFELSNILNASAKGLNVVSSVIVPSTIDTPLNRQSMADADPANWVTPGQIADVLEFICNDKGLPLREGVYKLYNNA